MTTIKSRYYWERIWKKEMSKCKQVMIWLISSYLLLMNNRLSIKFFTLCFIKNYHMIIRLDNVFQLRYTLLYIVSGKKKYHFLNWQPFNPFLLEIWQKLNYDYIFFSWWISILRLHWSEEYIIAKVKPVLWIKHVRISYS